MISIAEIDPKKAYFIRHKVLWPHKKINDCRIDIDHHEDAFHVGAYCYEELVSIGSFFKLKNKKLPFDNQYRLRAMATLFNYQKIGAAKALIDFSTEKLRILNQDIVWCDARIIAVPFYEKIGFIKIGDPYDIPIIGAHYLMYKTL